ncbi:YdbL family protein [Aliikangiella sp. G2MR2-5]|uniref:YdbL family protein n=1 Tax=Aliikangiella sp. G2MR2-5 TaxID=2788943 RepID=UPI0018A88ABE|nr:YdbL family protein [Aliikangiella sp. G2MR2-5]
MKAINYLILIFLLIFSAQLSASPLSDPKEKGIIGERFDGYLGIVKDASPEIQELVKSVNTKRKAHYMEIAKKRKQSLSQVQMVAGQTTIKKTQKGHYIFLQGKGWVKK